MELRHLRYFVAVAEEQNVTRAAAKLHISQPPLSRQIRSLEEELGVILFNRTANHLRLSDAGLKFRPDAIAILRHADRAAKRIAAFGKDRIAEIGVGYSGLAASDILPPLLRRFKRDTPAGLVRLKNMTFQESLVGLKNAKIDLALTVRSHIGLPRKVRFETLRLYQNGVYVSKKHPFASSNEVTLNEVLREPLVTFAKKKYPHYHQFLKSVFRGKGLSPRIVQECDGYDSLLAAISSGYGIAIMFELPKRLRPGMEFVPFKQGVDPMKVGILYRDERHGLQVAKFIKAARSLQSKRITQGPK
jgi:DNA-binding transcriptional LysR family regulator